MDTDRKLDSRVVRTRQRLLAAFFSLLAEKSFEEVTVLDIAARATVNRATFYAHFNDKYALVDELIRHGFAQVLTRHMTTQTRAAEEHIRQLLLAVCDYWIGLNRQCKQTYPLFESLVEAQVKAQVRDNLLNWLLQTHASRAQPRRTLELGATIISWAIYGAAMDWSQSPGMQSAEAFADEVLPLIGASLMSLGV